MKNCIKSAFSGVLTGILISAFVVAVIQLTERPPASDGKHEMLMTGIISLLTGWKISKIYHRNRTDRKFYIKGYNDGIKINTYFFSFHTEENNKNTEEENERISD